MTQSAERLTHRPDRAAPNPVGESEPAGHSAELTERIWGRYGGSPGIIPNPAALARRVSRLSTGRLPLLAAVQRRWAPAHSPFPPGPLGLPYARSPISATPWSPPAYAVQSTREDPLRRLGGPSPESWDAGQVSPRDTISARAAAGVSTPQSAAGKEARLTELRAARRAANGGTELGAAIWQRHLSGPAGRAIQHQGAETGLTRAGRAHEIATTGREAAIQRRPLGGRTGRTIQVQVGPTGRGAVEGRTIVGARAGFPVSANGGAPQPSGERGQPATGVGVASPTKVGTGDLGAVVLRHHTSGAVTGAIQPQGALPARIDSESPPVAGQPATLHPKINQVVPVTVANAGQAIMASTPYEGRIGPAPFGAGRASLSRAAARAGETITMRQLAIPLARTAPPRMAMFDRTSGIGGEPFAAPPALPLQKATERGTIRARVGSGMTVSASARSLGAPLGLHLQRAAAETPVGAPATATSGTTPPTPAEEPPGPTAATPGLEGPDLERLADEVIAIIERRLIVERESLGLADL